MHVTEYHFYSPIYDDDVVRVSMWNAHGDEYFAIAIDGKGYTGEGGRREQAIEALADAIEAERPAGEVFPFGALMEEQHFTSRASRSPR